MAKRVIMPALGMNQETGLVMSWLKQEGEMVKAGEPLLEVETDKAIVELEAEATGILTNITAAAGDTVPVAETIAWILKPGEALPVEAHPKPLGTAVSPPESADSTEPAPIARPTPIAATPLAARIAQENDLDLTLVATTGEKITKKDVLAFLDSLNSKRTATEAGTGEKLLPASPKARKVASENGFDLALIPGSGPDGAVITADVMAYSAAESGRPQQPAEATPVTVASGISQAWRVMAQRLTESWNSAPHFYLTRDVDVSVMLEWHLVAKKRSSARVTYTDLLVKVVAAALRLHPRLNASWINNDIQINQSINIGLAVAVEDGLLVPVIQEADKLNIAEIAAARAGIVERARAGKLRLNDLQAGTFTISNLGMYGIDTFNAVINPPQAAILAVGRITDRVVPLGGEALIRPMMNLTLSVDHRLVDGARGAQFLDTLTYFMEQPLAIL